MAQFSAEAGIGVYLGSGAHVPDAADSAMWQVTKRRAACSCLIEAGQIRAEGGPRLFSATASRTAGRNERSPALAMSSSSAQGRLAALQRHLQSLDFSTQNGAHSRIRHHSQLCSFHVPSVNSFHACVAQGSCSRTPRPPAQRGRLQAEAQGASRSWTTGLARSTRLRYTVYWGTFLQRFQVPAVLHAARVSSSGSAAG